MAARKSPTLASLLVALLFLGATWPSHVGAQTLRGRVVDMTGNPIAGVDISAYPESLTLTSDDSGRFTITKFTGGAQMLRLRHVGYRQVVTNLSPPIVGDSITIRMERLPVMLDEVRTDAMEDRLPRVAMRREEHLGAVIYGARLDSLLNREPGQTVEELLRWDRETALRLMAGGSQTSHCGVFTYVDGVLTRAPIRFYIDVDQIAAIEVHDSPNFVHEPFISSPFIDPSTGRIARCAKLVLVWSKQFRQSPSAVR